jgi:hypothetical protein
MNSVIFFKSDPFKSHPSKCDVQCVTGVTTESHRMLKCSIFLLLTRVLFIWIIHGVQKLMMHMLAIYLSLGRPAERRRSKASVSAADVDG